MDRLFVCQWSILITLMLSTYAEGRFKFNPVNNVIKCDHDTLTFSWKYDTNEVVTVLEWYKQPGVLIARIFGVHLHNNFTVMQPYNEHPYKVKNIPENSAVIQITGVSANDSGVYSVNVTAASTQSTVVKFNYESDCFSTGTNEEGPTQTQIPLIIGLSVGGVVLFAIFAIGSTCIVIRWRRKRKRNRRF